MPSFRFYSPDGTVFTSDSLGNKNSTVIIYFKTDCPYCGKEADIISKNINDFPSTDFIFITRSSDTADVRSFVALHKLGSNKRVRFLQDKEKLYYKFYAASYTPSIHIYDKNKKLKLFAEGILIKEELLKYIQ
jgi:peroxiredoxin